MAGLFGQSKKELKAEVVRLQATTEGRRQEIMIESMLTGLPIGEDDTTTSYRTYAAQTSAMYRKYNGEDELGNWQTRTVVDTRVGFIAGEGISVQCENDDTAEWIDKFLKCNKLKGSRFAGFVKAGEMEGRVLIYVVPGKENVRVCRVFSEHEGGTGFEIKAEDINDLSVFEATRTGGDKSKIDIGRSVFVKLGGDAGKINDTTTRVGLCLQAIDNYDRAMSGMRKNNHLFARVTPFFETTDEGSASSLLGRIKAAGWKLGQAFAGTAKFSLVTPQVGAMENIKSELSALAKSISAVTGIPIHWLGHVDMMSNRSTAEELYDIISNATSQDRMIWSETMYDLIVVAQGAAIDAGIGDIKEIDYDFSISIPVMSFTKLESYVNSLSKAFADGAIGIGTYRNMLPGVDPYAEKKAEDETNAGDLEELKIQVQNEQRKASDVLENDRRNNQGSQQSGSGTPQGGKGNSGVAY